MAARWARFRASCLALLLILLLMARSTSEG